LEYRKARTTLSVMEKALERAQALLDRGLDIGPAEFCGKPLAWLHPALRLHAGRLHSLAGGQIPGRTGGGADSFAGESVREVAAVAVQAGFLGCRDGPRAQLVDASRHGCLRVRSDEVGRLRGALFHVTPVGGCRTGRNRANLPGAGAAVFHRALFLYAFGQSLHFAVWLRLLPDVDRPSPTPKLNRNVSAHINTGGYANVGKAGVSYGRLIWLSYVRAWIRITF
jgi:hypothetical protein